MRRVLSFLICLTMFASLCACGHQLTQEEEVRKKAEKIVDAALQDTFGAPDKDDKADDADKDEKGTFEDPYQLGDGFEATLEAKEGHIKVRVSDVQVGEPEPEYQNHVPITFDLEILESDVSDPVDFGLTCDLYVSYLDSNNGMAWTTFGGAYTYDDDVIGQLFPDDYAMYWDRQYMPKVGAKWSFAILAPVEDGNSMDYLMFEYRAGQKDITLYFEV